MNEMRQITLGDRLNANRLGLSNNIDEEYLIRLYLICSSPTKEVRSWTKEYFDELAQDFIDNTLLADAQYIIEKSIERLNEVTKAQFTVDSEDSKKS